MQCSNAKAPQMNAASHLPTPSQTIHGSYEENLLYSAQMREQTAKQWLTASCRHPKLIEINPKIQLNEEPFARKTS